MEPFEDPIPAKHGRRTKAPRSTGVGESKPFIAEPGAFPAPDVKFSNLTVNGVPIPETMVQLIPYEHTDQGRAEFNAGKQVPRVQILRDDVDKSIEHYRDDLLADRPLEEANDPLRVLMAQNLPEGRRGLFMSEKKCDREGMTRGVLQYEPVLVEKDGKLERVKHGGMFLASVSETAAQRADKFYAEKARGAMVNAIDKVNEQTDEFMTERMQRNVRRQGRGEYDGITQEQGDAVANDLTHEFVG
jgi:hypothetical protein